MNKTRSILHGAALLALLTVAACEDPFQVIEELTFDPTLGIVLSDFTRLESGVYIQDMTVGTGPVTASGQTAVLEYVGYLANGSSFGEGEFPFIIGSGGTIAGFEAGIFGMQPGGERRLIIPPALGYGDSEQATIPAGSVLIFDVELCSLDGDGPGCT